MKPGDLVITVSSPPDWELAEEDTGLVGLIVRAVQFEDGHPISDWCDWWVMVGADHLEDHLQPFPAENLRPAALLLEGQSQPLIVALEANSVEFL